MKTENHPSSALPAPTDAEIRERAYYLWLEQGCPPNRDQEMWFAAKVLLHDRANPAPAKHPPRPASPHHAPEAGLPASRAAHDARPDVARTGAPQRTRSRATQNGSRRP
jgi:hypothetical protein